MVRPAARRDRNGIRRARPSRTSATDPKTRPLKTLERVLSKAGVGSVDMHRDRVRLDDTPLEPRERLYVLLYKWRLLTHGEVAALRAVD
jgi:hypothetical protein